MHLQAISRDNGPWRRSSECGAGPLNCSLVRDLVAAKTRATVLVDAHARLLSANAAATALLEDRGVWSVGSSQQIVHREARVTANLHSRIRTLAADGTGAARSAFLVDATEDQRTLVTLTRVGNDSESVACGRPGPMILIAISDGQPRRREQDVDLLTDVLGLTPTEARLALALTDGLSLQAYSAQAGVRITTTRWHLSNALAKTGCANQRDFVRLILTVTED